MQDPFDDYLPECADVPSASCPAAAADESSAAHRGQVDITTPVTPVRGGGAGTKRQADDGDKQDVSNYAQLVAAWITHEIFCSHL